MCCLVLLYEVFDVGLLNLLTMAKAILLACSMRLSGDSPLSQRAAIAKVTIAM